MPLVGLISPEEVNQFHILFQERFNRFYVGLLPDVFISDAVQPGLPSCHLNILVSAEFSLFSSILFYGPHSEPYGNAVGLMIVLKNLCFNSTGIFLSHINPETAFHFTFRVLVDILFY